MNPIKGFERHPIVHDAEDVYNDVVVMENADMVITKAEKIAMRYANDTYSKNPTTDVMWLEKELGYNANNDVIYVKTIGKTKAPPSWVPAAILS